MQGKWLPYLLTIVPAPKSILIFDSMYSSGLGWTNKEGKEVTEFKVSETGKMHRTSWQ